MRSVTHYAGDPLITQISPWIILHFQTYLLFTFTVNVRAFAQLKKKEKKKQYTYHLYMLLCNLQLNSRDNGSVSSGYHQGDLFTEFAKTKLCRPTTYLLPITTSLPRITASLRI